MDRNIFLASFVDNDLSSVVICDLNFNVVYMNKVAKETYKNRGGDKLIGQSLLSIHNPDCMFKITEVVHWFSTNRENNIVRTFYNEKENSDFYMLAIRDENGDLIGFSEKQEKRNKEDISFFQF